MGISSVIVCSLDNGTFSYIKVIIENLIIDKYGNYTLVREVSLYLSPG
ncbi:hypothetical protein GCM10007855_30570 [Aliivibrio sifiae]|uniref:Uncharacterized protein n=1 Tax=Aliivibrio sifiae TaxID=566293 RepID=A0ABQ6AL68_9GAMM|nr:hypothetical protein GCM10007855_30570 [Aliivibrio sifiae]